MTLTSYNAAATSATCSEAHLHVSSTDVGIGSKHRIDNERIAPECSKVKWSVVVPALCIRASAKVEHLPEVTTIERGAR
jgi:hypothetical protein